MQQGIVSEPPLDPILAAMKAEGERLIERQDTTVRQAVEHIVATLEKNRSQEAAIATIKDESALLAKRMEAGFAAGELSLQPVLDAMKREMERLSESQNRAVRQALSGAAVSLEPVTEALRELKTQMLESQARALREALGEIAARRPDDPVMLEPILAAMKTESERLLRQQDQAVRKAMADVVAKLKADLARSDAATAASRADEQATTAALSMNVREQLETWMEEILQRKLQAVRAAETGTVPATQPAPSVEEPAPPAPQPAPIAEKPAPPAAAPVPVARPAPTGKPAGAAAPVPVARPAPAGKPAGPEIPDVGWWSPGDKAGYFVSGGCFMNDAYAETLHSDMRRVHIPTYKVRVVSRGRMLQCVLGGPIATEAGAQRLSRIMMQEAGARETLIYRYPTPGN